MPLSGKFLPQRADKNTFWHHQNNNPTIPTKLLLPSHSTIAEPEPSHSTTHTKQQQLHLQPTKQQSNKMPSTHDFNPASTAGKFGFHPRTSSTTGVQYSKSSSSRMVDITRTTEKGAKKRSAEDGEESVKKTKR